MNNMSYILTTTDYPPRIGGLSTFTLNIEKSFKDCNVEYEVLHWKSFRDFIQYRDRTDIVFIHVHAWGSVCQKLAGLRCVPYINFYHGSEILFQGQTWIKRLVKSMIRPWVLKKFEQARYNIFISQFTLNQLEKKGFNVDYSKDIVFHNCINTDSSAFIQNTIDDEINLISVARDVAHKNLDGCLKLAEMLQAKLPEKKINLFVTSARINSSSVNVVNIAQRNDFEINELYKTSHFNLLLSLDHRKSGFFEGFGLTCLEAGKFGVPSIVFASGGLPENVHDNINGIVIESLSPDNIQKITDCFSDKFIYEKMRINTFEHTQSSHSLDRLKDLWKLVA